MQLVTWGRSLALGATCLFALAMAGCGESVGTVSGEVKFKGKPVPNGIITFVSQTGKKRTASGTITDGKYTVTVPATPCLISVQPITVVSSAYKDREDKLKDEKEKQKKEKEKAAKAIAKAKMKGKGKTEDDDVFPTKYTSEKSSGLEYTVTAGENSHNIDIP